MTGALSGGFLGLLLGMRHALEPDHLAAMSTLLTDRPRARAAGWIGASWGLGHSCSLLVVGGTLLLARTELPVRVVDSFELAVACMLIGLGLRSLLAAWRRGSVGEAARAPHAHRGRSHHHHVGPADHVHLGRATLARRPLLVGLLHGLAGSGALAALAVASAPGTAAGLIYIIAFGLGSTAGMALITGVSSLAAGRWLTSPTGRNRATATAGLVSLLLGLCWAAPLVVRLGA